jgi:hypothetical protein
MVHIRVDFLRYVRLMPIVPRFRVTFVDRFVNSLVRNYKFFAASTYKVDLIIKMYPKSNNMKHTSFDGCVIWRCANKHRNKTYIFLKILDCTVFSGTIIVSTSEISTIAVLLLLTEIKKFSKIV